MSTGVRNPVHCFIFLTTIISCSFCPRPSTGRKLDKHLTSMFSSSRLQAAKEEAVTAFKDTALGEMTGKNRRGVLPNARKITSKGGGGRERKYVTRAQRAKCEAYESFGGASLDSLPVRRKRKM